MSVYRLALLCEAHRKPINHRAARIQRLSATLKSRFPPKRSITSATVVTRQCVPRHSNGCAFSARLWQRRVCYDDERHRQALKRRGSPLAKLLASSGGSAIEFYTDGAYASGDLDLCLLPPTRSLPVKLRQEIMGELGGKGGPRSREVAGMFVDILGQAEISGRTPLREPDAPYGKICLIDPEELLVERTLISVYPRRNKEALNCAGQLADVALSGATKLDRHETRRLARLPEYDILPQLEQFWLARFVVNSKLKIPSIPIGQPISWEDWLRGRKFRREINLRLVPNGSQRTEKLQRPTLKKNFLKPSAVCRSAQRRSCSGASVKRRSRVDSDSALRRSAATTAPRRSRRVRVILFALRTSSRRVSCKRFPSAPDPAGCV
jgi:hypothetical protein